MNFFDKILGNSNKSDNDANSSFWKKICNDDDLNEAIQKSFHQKTVIFKHSTRCFISKTVLSNFEKEVKNSDKKAGFYFLDILAYRDLSNKIAEQFLIRHESPQIIILENGSVINHASHQSITLELV